MASKFVRTHDFVRRDGSDPDHSLEVDTSEALRAEYRVITGIGVRMANGDVTTLRVAARRLDPETGLLGGRTLFYSAGPQLAHDVEVEVMPHEEDNSENVLLSGLGLRAQPGDFTTLKVWTKNIAADGTLTDFQSWKFGPEPNRSLEAQLTLPDPLVVVGVGLRAQPGDITTLVGQFGRLVPRPT